MAWDAGRSGLRGAAHAVKQRDALGVGEAVDGVGHRRQRMLDRFDALLVAEEGVPLGDLPVELRLAPAARVANEIRTEVAETDHPREADDGDEADERAVVRFHCVPPKVMRGLRVRLAESFDCC